MYKVFVNDKVIYFTNDLEDCDPLSKGLTLTFFSEKITGYCRKGDFRLYPALKKTFAGVSGKPGQFDKMEGDIHKLKAVICYFFYSNKAAINSATQAGLSCPLISMVHIKVTLNPLLEISSMSLTIEIILN